MSKRLQVVMTEAEYDEIQAAASAARLTVSGWVRRTLRLAREEEAGAGDGGSPGGVSTARERPPSYGSLLERVMERYGLPDARAAIAFALRRAADPPLRREEILALEGTGWEGEMDALRSRRGPGALP